MSSMLIIDCATSRGICYLAERYQLSLSMAIELYFNLMERQAGEVRRQKRRFRRN